LRSGIPASVKPANFRFGSDLPAVRRVTTTLVSRSGFAETQPITSRAAHKLVRRHFIRPAIRWGQVQGETGVLLRLRYSTRIAKFASDPGECNISQGKRKRLSRDRCLTSRTIPSHEVR
jgi:hypothetical protein